MMMRLPRPVPPAGYPAWLRYPDVDDDVLAEEDAAEPRDNGFAWPAERRRQPVLQAADAAQAGPCDG